MMLAARRVSVAASRWQRIGGTVQNQWNNNAITTTNNNNNKRGLVTSTQQLCMPVKLVEVSSAIFFNKYK